VYEVSYFTYNILRKLQASQKLRRTRTWSGLKI